MKNLFNESHPHYHQFEQDLQARTPTQKILTIINYFLPGIVLTLFINVQVIHDYGLRFFQISSASYQFWLLIGLTFGWHIAYPIFMLKVKEGYSWKTTGQALNLDQFSVKGFFLVTPLFFLFVLLFAVPYMGFCFPPIHDFLQSIDLFAIPSHSIFHDYQTIYGFTPWQLGLLFIGNFVGEEIYFRGYLMKKSAFLGKHNWWIHSVLFSAYHLWQIPMTYALGFVSLAFGLGMIWRKNLYELMFLHLLINLLLPVIVQLVF